MGQVVDMPRSKLPTKDDLGFVQDMARYAEGGITTEQEIRKKYRLSDDAWNALGSDDELVRTITEEKTRRIRDGSSKREKAQLLVVKAPEVGVRDNAQPGGEPEASHRCGCIVGQICR